MPITPGSRRRDFDTDPRENKRGPVHVNPHSPWQLLIEETRGETLSIRDLAAKAKIPHATMYNWLRSKRGYPLPQHYTANVNRRLAVALNLEPAVLADAYNRSQPKLDPDAIEPEPRAPAPRPSENLAPPDHDGLERLLATLRATGAKTFTLPQIEAFASAILPGDPGDAD